MAISAVSQLPTQTGSLLDNMYFLISKPVSNGFISQKISYKAFKDDILKDIQPINPPPPTKIDISDHVNWVSLPLNTSPFSPITRVRILGTASWQPVIDGISYPNLSIDEKGYGVVLYGLNPAKRYELTYQKGSDASIFYTKILNTSLNRWDSWSGTLDNITGVDKIAITIHAAAESLITHVYEYV